MTDDEYPIDTITGWIRSLNEEEREEWKTKAGIDQAVYLRESIHPLLERSYDNRKEHHPTIVGWHTSKSCRLPVVKFETSYGMEVVIRGNFYDWKVSVKVSNNRVVPYTFYDLFDPSDSRSILACYCEGFPPEWVFGTYTNNSSEFTVAIPSSIYNQSFGAGLLFVFFFLLGQVMRDA